MNTNFLIRSLFPVAGVVLILLLVFQARSGVGVASGKAHAATTTPRQRAERVRAEGRMVAYPGAEVTIGAEMGGRIDSLPFAEGDQVRAGDVVATIDATQIEAELSEARSRLGESEADVALFELEHQRATRLWREAVGSRQDVDRRLRDLDAARARTMTVRAASRRLEAVLAKSKSISEISGVVTTRHHESGESVESGDDLLTVADVTKVRVEAEVDEFDTGRVRLGAEVDVMGEGFPGKKWRGRVEEIPDLVVARGISPQDPARPTDTRVLLVKVALLEATPLKLGQRVEVEIR